MAEVMVENTKETTVNPILLANQKLTIRRGDYCGWIVLVDSGDEFVNRGVMSLTAAFSNVTDLQAWIARTLELAAKKEPSAAVPTGER